MPITTRTALAALLLFGSATAVLADTDTRTDRNGSVARPAVSAAMPNGRTGPVNHAVKSFTAEEKAWFAAPQLRLALSTPACRLGVTDRTMAWIELTEPGGNLIHVNVEQVTSVRSGTQIPGARAQLDFVSGKL